MIIGIGLDLVELSRIRAIYNKFGNRFSGKILTPGELAGLPPDPVAYLGSRFAAKEAGVKALGTGFALGVTLQNLEIISNHLGKPELFFSGAAGLRAAQMNVHRIHLSISHGRDTAVALVILETSVNFQLPGGGQ